MGKHSKNNCAAPVYTYHERQLDGKQYGTQAQRLGKESVKDFDCCCLSLQPCKDPMITEHGYLYDKEAIFEYILHQKRENARKLKLYEEEVTKQQAQSSTTESESAKKAVDEFVKLQNSVSGDVTPLDKLKERKADDRDVRAKWDPNQTKLQRNFWIPENTPTASKTTFTKPDQNVYRPMSGKKLRIKDLIPVKFKLIDESAGSNLAGKKERCMCPLTFETLTNSYVPPCGMVVTMAAVSQIIEKDMLDPFSGQKLTDADIIPVVRGGTGYSGAGVDLMAKKYTPAMRGS